MRILFLLSRFPYPLEKGDKLRAWHQLQSLSQKHEIILFAVSDQPVTKEQIEHVKPYCKEIVVHRIHKPGIALRLAGALFSGKPFQVAYFTHPKAKAALEKVMQKHNPEAVFCQLIRMAEYCRHLKQIPTTLDYMDTFSKAMQRRGKVAPWYMKVPVSMEYRRLLKYEEAVFDDFAERVIISKQDRDLIPHPENSRIHVIPNGVDHGFYQPMERPKKHDLLFMGNMAYPPNVESAVFLVKEILPLLAKERPETNVLIAGATPAAEVRALAGPNVTVTGWVEDIREAFAESRIMIAPMLISVGLQNKILQAMAMKIPVVSSKLANNALQAPVPETIREATKPAEYAKEILDLLENPEKATQMAEKGYDFVLQRYDWDKVNAELEKVITG